MFILEQFNGSEPSNSPTPSPTNKIYVHYRKYENLPLWEGEYSAGFNLEADSKVFWCDVCKTWLKTSTTSHTIMSHISSSKHKKNAGITENLEERPTSEVIANTLHKFIMIRGHPFREVEDPLLQSITSHLGTRKEMSKLTAAAAETVIKKVDQILQSGSHITFTADEWTSHSNARYFGITAQIYDPSQDKKVRVLTLAQRHIPETHFKSEDMRKLFDSILMEHHMRTRDYHVVTDSAFVCRKAFEDNAYLWHPCVCHQMNLFTGKFVQAMAPFFDHVLKLQNSLSHSQSFSAYLRSCPNVKRQTIPFYSSTRWYSMSELFSAVKALEAEIREFMVQEKPSYQPIDIDTLFGTVDYVVQFFKMLTAAYERLEADEYGAISYVIPVFKLIRLFVDNNMREDKYNEAVIEFNKAWTDHSIGCFVLQMEYSSYSTLPTSIASTSQRI